MQTEEENERNCNCKCDNSGSEKLLQQWQIEIAVGDIYCFNSN